MSRAKDIVLALENLQRELKEPLNIVETGTIRNTAPEYHQGDGHSTVYIAEYIKEKGGTFTSIDLDIWTCAEYLKVKKLDQYVKLIQGDSVETLKGLEFNVAYLDSANDADLIFNEFMICLYKSAKLIIVDDFSIDSEELQKGKRVYEYVLQHGLKHNITQRQLYIWNTTINQ